MPYTNVPDELQDKMESCVQSVMDKGQEKEGAIAICYASVVEGKSLPLEFQFDAMKIGARNNARDAERLQQIHDLAAENGATCAPNTSPEITELPFMSLSDDALVIFGSAVKSLGNGKVGGYLVRFGGEQDTDLTTDYFDKLTEYGVIDGGNLPVYYDHGMNETIKNKRIGRGKIQFQDAGLWMEAQLELRDEYEKKIYAMAEMGKLGWSSGAAGHLVEKEAKGKASYIRSWPIAEASLTLTPAEPRNHAIPIKSLIPQADGGPGPVKEEILSIAKPEPIRGVKMEFSQEEIQKMISDAAIAAVKVLELEPASKKAGVAVVEDEADRALKGNPFTYGEFLLAVKNAATQGAVDKRLLPLKAASGMNETIPSQGGYLLQPQFAQGILNKVYGPSTIMNKVRWFDLGPNSNELVVNMIDETARADGSRLGGMLGYWLAEAASKTASKPKLRQLSIKLHKVAALCYATDELLEDAVALESFLGEAAPDELRFKVEAAIYSGDGVGKPAGWMDSPSRIIVARDTTARILAADVVNMWTRLWPSLRPNAEWYVSPDADAQLYQLYLQTGVAFPFYTFTQDGVSRLFGRPINVNEYSSTLNTAGDIALIAPNQYFGVRKGGVQAASSIHVLFTTDESAFRYVMRVGGEDSWHSPITSYGSSTTLSDVVILGSASATTT